MAAYSRDPWASERQALYAPPSYRSESDRRSPFHDKAYPAESNDSLDTTYDGHAVGTPLSRQESDPLESSDNIPLQHTKIRPTAQTTRLDSERSLEDGPRATVSPVNSRGGLVQGKAAKIFSRNFPWLTYTLTLIQVIVFIVELVKNAQLTGTPIEIHPNFNPMIGPSPYVLINMGARFVPCMRNEHQIQDNSQNILFPCPNATTTTNPQCTLSDLCGMGGVPNPHPNGSLNDAPAPDQWWRFITPIFMHAGFIHIGANMLLQVLLGRDMERVIGPVRFFLVYFASGIFGFVLGGNFAGAGISSTGASGALFGIHALVAVDLAYTWKDRRNPVKDLMFLLIIIIISFVIGLLPSATDNFSHIGGFLMGLVLGVSILHSPSALRKYIGPSSELDAKALAKERRRPAAENSMIHGTKGSSAWTFVRQPISFFQDRKPLWWAWWLVRALALVGVFAGFIALINNFYTTHSSNCSWCKYLSCIPINNWCDIGNFQTTNVTTGGSSGSTRRWLLEEQTFGLHY